MRVNALHPFLIALIATVVSLGFPLMVAVPRYFGPGIIREGNSYFMVGALWFLIQMAFWLAAFVLVGFSFRALMHRRIWSCAVLAVAAVSCVVSPFLTEDLLSIAVYQAELRDLDAATVAALRDEAAALTSSDFRKNRDGSWFGYIVPPQEVPPTLQRFSRNGDHDVQVWEDGVVIKLDGIAAWRGGYLFQPPGSSPLSPGSFWGWRFITDGVYYVTTR